MNAATAKPPEICAICQQSQPPHELTPAELVRPAIQELIRKDCSRWGSQSWICREDLHHYRTRLIETMLCEERGELSELDEEVLSSLRENDLIAKDLNTQLAERRALGEQLADLIAKFGGSWKFVLLCVGVLMVWVIVNSVTALQQRFDPYPFILLNLVLSCIAALQAPIIMMSQNRQEKRDRLRSEQDYKVNLKAELEVRMLMAKIDQLRQHQWQRLLEIQRIQTELMQEILGRRDGTESTPPKNPPA